MADIELVIKIPEEVYEAYKSILPMLVGVGMDMIAQAIANGTPIPKGHGRLIDVSNLLTVTDIKSDGSEFTYVSYSEIDDAPTIIPADKEGEENENNTCTG